MSKFIVYKNDYGKVRSNWVVANGFAHQVSLLFDNDILLFLKFVV